MRTITILILVAILPFSAATQNLWQRAKISGNSEFLNTIGTLGIPVEGEIRVGEYLISDFSTEQIEKMQQAGLTVEILIPDIQTHYINQVFNEGYRSNISNSCFGTHDYPIPANFNHGTMGGYLTLSEMYAELDQMHSLFPQLISGRQLVDTIHTKEGRQLYYVKISDNPDSNEPEPQVMFLSLTHAREPMGMQQLIFFMWYLLENYASDAEIQYLIQNTEIYFIPCVNPDGYEYNHATNPNGGGMWRKNRRDNGDGSFGVDLNRNYGFHWGYDDIGSSPLGSDETYRGTAAFSEAEPQAVRNFCQNHQFKLIQDYHTYSNVVLYPWGYIDEVNPDSTLYNTYSGYMTSENAFAYGTANQCIGYNANGGSFDWYYGDQVTKNKIIAWGPEVGDPIDGFWPAESLIDNICKLYIAENMYMVRFASKYAAIEYSTGNFISGLNIPFTIQRLGMDSPATYTVSLNALSTNVMVLNSPKTYNNLALLETRADTFDLSVYTNIENGEALVLELVIDNGFYSYRDTILKYFGTTSVVFQSDGSSTTGWSGSWGTTNSTYVSSPSSITDSPGGNYPNDANSSFTLSNNIDLSNVDFAELSFYAKWDIENDYDYVAIQASSDNGATWQNLCGRHSSRGSASQMQDEPVYDGKQNSWIYETVDLTDYIGQQIKIRFHLVSDSWVDGDGFYFDDMEITTMISTGIEQTDVKKVEIFPNPATKIIHVGANNQSICIITNVFGQVVMQVLPQNGVIDISNLSAGIYFLNTTVEGQIARSMFVKAGD